MSMAQQVNASLEVAGQVDTTISVFKNNLDQNDVTQPLIISSKLSCSVNLALRCLGSL